ncbi:MAG: peptidyl-alpha-hydroxyglycine alpha-amidating lyase family protein [Longimicrobiales bacterium]
MAGERRRARWGDGVRVLLAAWLAMALGACERDPFQATRDAEPSTEIRAQVDSVIVGYRAVVGWPQLQTDLHLGEVAGIAVDAHDHVFLFHRAGRGWDTETVAPIAEPTVLQLDGASGRLLQAWGANRFRLPHGVTLDAAGNVWLTDAALHQVFEFSHEGVPLRVLGQAGVPRWDGQHFNRPTDVATREDGRVFISDGYENQRVVEVDADGRYTREWGRRGSGEGEFELPHSIVTFAGSLLVADRDNNRIVVFDSNGAFRSSWKPVPSARVYALAVDAMGGLFVGVRNDGFGVGAVVRLDGAGRVTHSLGALAQGSGEFLAVHDIAVGADGALYIAENREGSVRKFVPVKAARATKQ